MAKAAWWCQEQQVCLKLSKLCYHPLLAADEGKVLDVLSKLYDEKKNLLFLDQKSQCYAHSLKIGPD